MFCQKANKTEVDRKNIPKYRLKDTKRNKHARNTREKSTKIFADQIFVEVSTPRQSIGCAKHPGQP